MPSIDANHHEIGRLFRAHGAKTVDLSGIGGGVPDWLIGFGGQERLVETKTEKELPGVRRPSSRCAECDKTYPSHLKKKRGACAEFKRGWKVGPSPGGVVSSRQKKWAREWAGSEPELARNEKDVERILDAMRI